MMKSINRTVLKVLILSLPYVVIVSSNSLTELCVSRSKSYFSNLWNFNCLDINIEARFEHSFDMSALCIEKISLPILSGPCSKTRYNKGLSIRNTKTEKIYPNFFTSFPEMRELQISDNKLTRIEANVFSNLTKLETLNLTNNLISALDDDCFSAMSNLQNIDLSYNQITVVPQGIITVVMRQVNMTLIINLSKNKLKEVEFNFSGKVDRLDLSENEIQSVKINNRQIFINDLDLSRNKIKTLPNWFNVTKCNFSNNMIQSINNTAIFTTNLKTLDLSNNELSRISQEIFAVAPGQINMTSINLSGNKLEEVQFNFSQMFVTDLNLSKNKIKTLPLWLNVTKCNFSFNMIQSLNKTIFTSNLETLDLSNNKISILSLNIPHEMNIKNIIVLNNRIREINFNFSGNIYDMKLSEHELEIFNINHENLYLDNLDLSRQNIKVLPHWLDVRICNVRLNIIKSLDNTVFANRLEKLDLSYNNLTSLILETFINAVNLRFLNLSHNMISILPVDIFSNVINMESLDLSYNSIHQLVHGHLNHLNRLWSLDISNNNMTLEFGILSTLSDLQTLSIQNNNIRNFDAEILNTFLRLQTVTLGDNIANCSTLVATITMLNNRYIKVTRGQSSKGTNILGIACQHEDHLGEDILTFKKSNSDYNKNTEAFDGRLNSNVFFNYVDKQYKLNADLLQSLTNISTKIFITIIIFLVICVCFLFVYIYKTFFAKAKGSVASFTEQVPLL